MEFLTVGFSLVEDAAMAHMGELPENSFRGMAVVFGGLIDSWVPTMLHAGAFTKTLQEKGRGIKLLWQHDAGEPIGVPEYLAETDSGLALQGKISLTARGKDVLQLMRDGVMDALSIGFDTIKEDLEYGPNGDLLIRHIREVRLWEVSCVTWGADPNAKITEVHSKGMLGKITRSLFTDLPVAEKNAAWSVPEAACRVAEYAGNVHEVYNPKYVQAFAWSGDKQAAVLIADVSDGKLVVVPAAIFSAAVAVQKDLINIPDEEKTRVRNHLEKYFAKMRRQFDDPTIIAPWDGNSLAGFGHYAVEDSMWLLGQKLLDGLDLEDARTAFALIGALPETQTPEDVYDPEQFLLGAEIAFMEMQVEP